MDTNSVESVDLEGTLTGAELWLEGQKRAFESAINGAPLAESLKILIGTANRQFDGGARCAFYLANDSATELHHVVGMPEEYARCVAGFKIGPESLTCGLAVYRGMPCITPDVREDPRWQPWLWMAEKFGYRGCWSFPIKTSVGRVIGSFALYFQEPRSATARERELANVLAHAAAIIIARHHEAERRTRAELILRESEERFRLAQLGAGIATFEWNISKNQINWSPELKAMYGLSRESDGTSREDWERLIHRDDRTEVIQRMEESLQTGFPVQKEWRILHPDGSVRWISGRWQVFKNAAGMPVRVVGINIDITERKAAEEARQRLAAIVESSDDAIISKDLNGIITSWNQQATRLFGYTEAEMYGRSMSVLIPPDLQHEEEVILHQIRNGEKINHFETVRVAKSGEKIEVSLSMSPVKDEHGEVVGAAIIGRDIRESKQIERTLRVTEKLAATGRLAATVAHEINNPLEAVTNLLYLASGRVSDPTASEYLESAQYELKRIAQITRQTLGFYRDTSTPALLNVPQAIDDLLGLYEQKLSNNQICVMKECDRNAEIVVLGGEIRQVIANLLTNAIDAMKGGGTLRIRVRKISNIRNDSISGLRITIADSGDGIPAENRLNIFQPFFTTKASVGTGLGLWISKTIVEKHHGVLQFRSRTGFRHGTVFSFTLPREMKGVAQDVSVAA